MITMVAAVSSNWILGADGRIPWRKPADLRRFRQITDGSFCICGRKTWESIGRRLPNRTVCILSKALADPYIDGVIVARNVADAITMASGQPICIIGGGEIYDACMPYVTHADITYVSDFEAPTGAQTYLSEFVRSELRHVFSTVALYRNQTDATLVHHTLARQIS